MILKGQFAGIVYHEREKRYWLLSSPVGHHAPLLPFACTYNLMMFNDV